MLPFTWGSLTPELEDAAAQLEPGQLSPVIRTPDGWSVIFLVDTVDAVRPPLDDRVSERIAARLRERNAEALSEALSARLWSDYGAEIVLRDRTPSILLKLLRDDPEMVAIRWNDGKLALKEVFTLDELKMFAALPPGRAGERVDATLRTSANTALVRVEALKRKVDEDAVVAEQVDAFEARLVESALYAKHVLSAVKVADDEVRAAFERQQATLFVPEKRRVAHIAVATEPEAKTLHARLRKGEDFAGLLKAHTLDKPSIKSDGDLG